MEPKKFIDFIITQKCTYRCPYCSQSKNQCNDLNNASKETIESFYKFLDTLEKDFEITITGGEAILHPEFYSIIETIKQKVLKFEEAEEMFGIKITKFEFSKPIENTFDNIK